MDLKGLSAICAGLGVIEEDENGDRVGYSKEQYCLDNLKDLLRFLRRDDPENRPVFKQVCKWNTAAKDLIPIIEYCQDDRNLVLNAVKVLVFLSMPVEPMSSDIAEQLEHLWGLKTTVTLSDIVPVIVSLLESPLENLESEAFTEEDWKLVQLVLTFFRNFLAVQDISPNQKAAGSSCLMLSLRDKFVELLFRENVMDLILVIAQHVEDLHSYLRQDNMLLLEIVHHMFMGQDPQLVARVRSKGLKEDGDTKISLSSLSSIMDEENVRKMTSRLHTSNRHSQFIGTFARCTMDGNKAIVKGNLSSDSLDLSLKFDNFSHRSKKKIVGDHGITPTINNSILELLHDFVNQFLSGGYNVFMQSVHEDIEREHLQIQKSDIVNFFKVTEFVTSFQYHKSLTSKSNTGDSHSTSSGGDFEDNTIFKGGICGPIAASINESMFLLVISRWRDAFDTLKETKDYGFLAASGSLLKAMIRMLYLVLKLLPENSREPQTARILLYKLFYDQTDQGMTQFILNQIKSFDEHKQSRSNLADLVEIVYMIVRLMERLQNRGTLRVSKKSRKTRKKKSSTDKIETETGASTFAEEATPTQEKNGTSNDKGSAKENDVIVQQNVNSEGTSIRLGSDSPDNPEISMAEPEEDKGDKLQPGKPELLHDPCDETSDSSDDEQFVACNEVDFSVSTLVSTFANNSIIHNLCWLLKFYKSNGAHTNHHIITILRNISDDLELSPMLYQLSLMTIFHEILIQQKSRPSNEYAAIVNFLTDLVRRMLRKLKHQPLLFVELLFWKSRKECHHINAEHLLHEVGNLKKQDGNYERVSNGETRKPHSAGWTRRSIADALGDDEADVVLPHDFEPQTNEMQDERAPEMTTSPNIENDNDKEGFDSARRVMGHEDEPLQKKRRRLILNSDMETKLRDLHDKFKDDPNSVKLIAEALDSDGKVSSAQVLSKLKQLGLIDARRQKMQSPFSDSNQHVGEGSVKEVESSALNSDNPTKGSRRQPFHTRKRISALSEDQEARLKNLFEEFKDHKRCSHMIAKALDGDSGTFTAAQISRKLKKLGLQVPKRKKTEEASSLRDKKMTDSEDDHVDSDDETLLSIKLRGKSKENTESQEKNLEGNDDPDEEPLSSLLNKSQPRPSKRKKGKGVGNQKPASPSKSLPVGDGANDMVIEDPIKRDGSGEPGDSETAGAEQTIGLIDTFKPGSNTELEKAISGDRPGSPLGQPVGSSLHHLEDDLDNSGDDMSMDVSSEVSIKRRLRFILDDDDED